jgi:flavin reductase (DIM6/NTAB) family NADH-FMN oxidoreductase RutF
MKWDIADLDWKEAHELMAGTVIPRPIALISTVGENGVFNVAPYSFFGVASVKPAIVFVGIGAKVRVKQKKDTLKNIEFAKDFVINIVDEALAEPMNQTSADYPSDVSEFKEVGLTPVKSDLVKAPRVKESPIHMECQLRQIMEFGEFPYSTDVVIGEVLRVHVRDDLWMNGAVQMSGVKAIARLGGELFCRTADIFELKRPYPLGQ